MKAHERHSADVSWCPMTLCVKDKHVHTFEIEKQTNIKKEETISLIIMLATYDSSNAWAIRLHDSSGGCENCEIDWF